MNQEPKKSPSVREAIPKPRWHELMSSLKLSPREREIVELLFEDEPDVSIAERLGISVHTVHTYIERLYRKLGVRNRAQLFARIFAQYILVVEPDD